MPIFKVLKMGCLKLTYQISEPQLKVVHRRHSHEKKCVQRFLSVDPLAERHPDYSPYVYVLNNPLNIVDPDGLTDYKLNKGTGEINEVQNKHINDKTDRLLKTDSN